MILYFQPKMPKRGSWMACKSMPNLVDLRMTSNCMTSASSRGSRGGHCWGKPIASKVQCFSPTFRFLLFICQIDRRRSPRLLPSSTSHERNLCPLLRNVWRAFRRGEGGRQGLGPSREAIQCEGQRQWEGPRAFLL